MWNYKWDCNIKSKKRQNLDLSVSKMPGCQTLYRGQSISFVFVTVIFRCFVSFLFVLFDFLVLFCGKMNFLVLFCGIECGLERRWVGFSRWSVMLWIRAECDKDESRFKSLWRINQKKIFTKPFNSCLLIYKN